MYIVACVLYRYATVEIQNATRNIAIWRKPVRKKTRKNKKKKKETKKERELERKRGRERGGERERERRDDCSDFFFDSCSSRKLNERLHQRNVTCTRSVAF